MNDHFLHAIPLIVLVPVFFRTPSKYFIFLHALNTLTGIFSSFFPQGLDPLPTPGISATLPSTHHRRIIDPKFHTLF